MEMEIPGNDYEISCDLCNVDRADTVVVAMHGFAGDKESSCIALLRERLAKDGVGLAAFDWPAHGKSPVDGQYLRVPNCLQDIDTVCGFIREKKPDVKLCAFATSFGGYLTLLYHYYHPETFAMIMLRSPALRMSEILDGILDGVEKEKDGWPVGFDRKFRVSEAFREDLRRFDLLEMYRGYPFLNDVRIIHGDADDLAPYADSAEFCREHDIRLETIAGADHRYKKPGELGQVIDLAETFFTDCLRSM